MPPLRVKLENAPSKMTAAEQLFSHLISVNAGVSADYDATKLPGCIRNVAPRYPHQ